jgi:hypothetical protein
MRIFGVAAAFSCAPGVYFNPGEMHDIGRRSWLVNEPIGFHPCGADQGASGN